MKNDTFPQAGHVEDTLSRRVDWLYGTLRRNRLTRFPWAVIQTFSDAEGALLSGSMAYYTFLSLLPLLMITGFLIGTLAQYIPGFERALDSGLGRFMPGETASQLLQQLIGSRAAFGVAGLVAVAYAGSGFVGALTACLNRMWGVSTGRNPVGQKLLNIVVVALLGVVLLGSAGLTLWVSFATKFLFGEESAGGLVSVIEVAGSPLSLFLVILLLYRLLPGVDVSWKKHLPGAAFGALGIEILKKAFALWAQHSAGVAVLPRSVLSVVLLLLWMGFFGQVILYGAALNVVLDRRRRGEPLFPAGQPSGDT